MSGYASRALVPTCCIRGCCDTDTCGVGGGGEQLRRVCYRHMAELDVHMGEAGWRQEWPKVLRAVLAWVDGQNTKPEGK